MAARVIGDGDEYEYEYAPKIPHILLRRVPPDLNDSSDYYRPSESESKNLVLALAQQLQHVGTGPHGDHRDGKQGQVGVQLLASGDGVRLRMEHSRRMSRTGVVFVEVRWRMEKPF